MTNPYNFLSENDAVMKSSQKDAFGRSTGFSPNAEGYDISPEAKLAFLDKEFKGGSSQNKRAVFNEAFRAARKAGLKEFTLGGKRYTTELAEEKKARLATRVAEKAVDHIIRNEGLVHQNTTKAQFDMMEAMKFTTAPALNTLPVPEDVGEREAIGSAGIGFGKAQILGALGAGAITDAAMMPALYRGWRNLPGLEKAASQTIQTLGRTL